MSPFVFRLERVLKLKEANEEQHKQELAEAQRRARAAERAVAETGRRLKERERQLRELRSGPMPIERARLLMDYIDRLRRDLAEQESHLRTCVEMVEDRRNALIEAMKERKTLEVLRERDLEAYRIEEARRDQRAMDEMAQNLSQRERQGRRQASGGPGEEDL